MGVFDRKMMGRKIPLELREAPKASLISRVALEAGIRTRTAPVSVGGVKMIDLIIFVEV